MHMALVKTQKMKKILYFLPFLILLISCEQIRSGDLLNETREDVLEEKVENRDINLPTGSTILEEGGGFRLDNLFSGMGSNDTKFTANTLTFNVAMDKLSFMPLISADINSGVIITDWYSLGDGNQRIKINLRITDQYLSDESIKVSLFKQSYDGSRWIDKGQDIDQALKVRESILNEARSLKIAAEL